MYNLPYVYAYALPDKRRITLVLMHILIQSPSSYKTSDNAETHMQHSPLLLRSMEQEIKQLVVPIVASSNPCMNRERLLLYPEDAHPYKQRNPYSQKKSETTLHQTLN